MTSLRINGAVVEGDVVITTGVPTPVSTPVPLPIMPPVPTPASVPPGWTPVVNPLTIVVPRGQSENVPFDCNRLGQSIFHCDPNQIHIHSLKFDSAVYTSAGAALTTQQTSDNPNIRNMVVSDIPGAITPLGKNWLGQALNSAEYEAIYCTFIGTPGKFLLSKDTQYYLMIWSSLPDTPVDYILSAGPTQ